jgi:hypothetical protein
VSDPILETGTAESAATADIFADLKVLIGSIHEVELEVGAIGVAGQELVTLGPAVFELDATTTTCTAAELTILEDIAATVELDSAEGAITADEVLAQAGIELDIAAADAAGEEVYTAGGFIVAIAAGEARAAGRSIWPTPVLYSQLFPVRFDPGQRFTVAFSAVAQRFMIVVDHTPEEPAAAASVQRASGRARYSRGRSPAAA